MGATLLAGSVVTLLLQVFKWLVQKFGRETTTAAIYFALFVLCLAYTVLTQANLISATTVTHFLSVGLTAVGTYEVVVKRLYSLFSTGATTSSTP